MFSKGEKSSEEKFASEDKIYFHHKITKKFIKIPAQSKTLDSQGIHFLSKKTQAK